MDFHQLKVFASVFRHKSFTKASEEMCVSQPTISEHIKNLEQEFACRLFDRLGRTIAPTQRAERLYPRSCTSWTTQPASRKSSWPTRA